MHHIIFNTSISGLHFTRRVVSSASFDQGGGARAAEGHSQHPLLLHSLAHPNLHQVAFKGIYLTFLSFIRSLESDTAA